VNVSIPYRCDDPINDDENEETFLGEDVASFVMRRRGRSGLE
jgi:hypothetical protein